MTEEDFETFEAYPLLTTDTKERMCYLTLLPAVKRIKPFWLRQEGISKSDKRYQNGAWGVIIVDKSKNTVFQTRVIVEDKTAFSDKSLELLLLPSNCRNTAVDIAHTLAEEFGNAIATSDQCGKNEPDGHNLILPDGKRVKKWSPDFIRNILKDRRFETEAGEVVEGLIMVTQPLYQAPIRTRVKVKR